MLEDIFYKIKDFIQSHKKLVITLLIVGVFVFMFYTMVQRWNYERSQAEEEGVETEEISKGASSSNDTIINKQYQNILDAQESLVRSYGALPDGFLWSLDGKVLSVGDKSMTAEEVVYAYFNGLSNLDILSVQRYSRGSSVVLRYESYFDSSKSNNSYNLKFLRDVYREALMSLQVNEIMSSTVFAENKTVFTLKAKMLDLSDKDFWQEDKDSIYKNLYIYNLESDSAKYQNFIYDYVISYYRSGSAKLRDVTFDITLEKFMNTDSGWLVSIDADVDDACSYKNGNLIVDYIFKNYESRGRNEMERREKEGTLDEIASMVYGLSGENYKDYSSQYYSDYNGSYSDDYDSYYIEETELGVSGTYDYYNDGSFSSTNPLDYYTGRTGNDDNIYELDGLMSDDDLYESGLLGSDNDDTRTDDSGTDDGQDLTITTTDDFIS